MSNDNYQFDFDSIILRRADPDDCEQIINLVEIGKDDIYNRIYSYPKILKLIETAYLSITVLDREGNVVAFAAFEDYPQGMRGMYDEKHYNFWEGWFREAYQVEEFTSQNTLWLSYFISGGSIKYYEQKYAFKKILQTAYTSLPDLIGVMFLIRGDTEEEDQKYCFAPLAEYFEELNCQRREILKNVRGIHFNSKIYFSSRVLVLPFIEIRNAKEEDHDDLADVFNSQSETVTEAYGEYFIAELIAASQKSDSNKALVAQVKDKAVGLMGLTSEVDVKLLHQCFELDSFDNLLKSDYMDAIRKRREYILEEKRKIAESSRLGELKRLKEETMKCNIIAQRMALQEFLISKSEEINAKLGEYKDNEEERKLLDKENVTQLMLEWIREFQLVQPSDYFLQHPTDDYELSCNIQTELEFMISTLEIFGLPQGYMNLEGHHADWEEKQKAERQNLAKKKINIKKNKKGPNPGLQNLRKKKGFDKQNEEEQKPTYFDLVPFEKAFKSFIDSNANSRSILRMTLKQNKKAIKQIFQDKQGLPSFKKCVNIKEFGNKLKEKQIYIEDKIANNIGPMLICFGDIAFELKSEDRMPEESEEEKKRAQRLKQKEEEDKKAAEMGDDKKNKKKEDKKKQERLLQQQQEQEEEKKEEKKEPPKPIRHWLYITSIHDLLQSISKMQDYDFVMSDLGVIEKRIFEEEMEQIKNNPRDAYYEVLNSKQEREFAQMDKNNKVTYSKDPVYNALVQDIDDLEVIPDAPDKAKNVIAITLFCMEAAFDSRSKDFLKYAFEQFPDRDYLIVTQPHTVAENSLLQKFTLVEKRPENTFAHVLYILHKDQMLEQDMSIQRSNREHFDQIKDLIQSVDDNQKIFETFQEATINPDSPNVAFVAKIYDDIIGAFVLAKDVNLDYYKSHFHIQDAILLNEHERKAHTRLIYTIINPIFERSTRFILKELLRLTANTCLYFEIHDQTIIPQIFYELVHVRLRRFPHFLDKKWDHERYNPNQIEDEEENKSQIKENGYDRDYLDEKESSFTLCFTTKRLLSEPKITKNSRIVVVGASDTGISFIEALLSISYLKFTNIVLIAPGGLLHHQYDDKVNNLKSQSTSYTYQELKRLMLESRVRVINGRMVDIDMKDKNIILNDETIIPYDTMVLSMGIQDKTLNQLGYVSRGIAPLPKDKKRIEGLMSIDDPYLYQHLRPNGTLMNLLTNRRRPQNCVIYGRTLNAYACIQGLIQRGMKYEQIILVIPGKNCHVMDNYDDEEELDEDRDIIYPNAFPDENIEKKIHRMLENKGLRIIQNALIMEIFEDDENQIDSVLFKLLDIPDEEEEDDELEGIEEKQSEQLEDQSKNSQDMKSAKSGNLEDNESQKEEQVVQKKKRKKNELDLQCKVLITAGHRDVDQDVFYSIHNNGLVYNGRLIVDKNFQTTDPSIFAAGSLCEFSGRYKGLSQGRSLRMDRYNGREMGSRLAKSVFEIYDNATGNIQNENQSSLEDELPTFYLPQGQGSVIPGNLNYYHIKTTNPLILVNNQKEVKNRKDLVCDNLNDETLKGHFIKFEFNSIGVIDSVTYIGSEDIILQSLWSFVGLHENYLNQLTSRFEHGIIPNVVEFLSENWSIALYHEWFGDFCLRMRQSLQGLKDVQVILEKAFEMTKKGEGLKRENYQQLKEMLDPKTIRMVEDETLEFIKCNMNHLPMYYIPGEEFP